ncbi:MAG TPA: TIM barrel protein [Cyclobacteriaceae bacterium]|jgi:hydroxypyruvate isomerase|nr:TIM barrel protein [Cyclobacteriaceae bacterium]
MTLSRKQALKTMAMGAAGSLALPNFALAFKALSPELKNNINHSVCKWCFPNIPLEELVIASKEMGIKSVELLRSEEWPVVIKHGLTCAMGYATTISLNKGFNDPTLHEQLLKDYSVSIPKAAEAGLKNLICFSGNTNGLTSEQGLENCAKGLEPVMKIAAQYNITVSMELLNSKINHKDYQCDHTEWGVKLCEKLGSENFKLLYDIYHMQVMEGDVIGTLTKYKNYIAHYHTAGVPGRHEIDDTQELNYPAIMKAIIATGFKGHVAQEFVPAKPDKIASLKQAVDICDI